MAERKNTNPFHTEDPTPHLPPSVYQPNPFPHNPVEGNPWASAPNEQPYQQPPNQGHVYDNSSSSSYGHSYNNTSSDQSTYSTYTMQMPMPMPTPSVNAYNTNNSSPYSHSSSTYNNNNNNPYNSNAYNPYNANAYNNYNSDINNPNINAYSNPEPPPPSLSVNAYEPSNSHVDDYNVKSEQENTHDDNTAVLDESVSASNPGIETHDPDKLKVSSGMIKASLSGIPNKWRFFSRFIQFLAGAGALGFIIGAPLVSKEPATPTGVNKVQIVFIYVVSIVSIIYSFGHLIFYCLRRWRHKDKAPRWSLLIIDAVIGASFGTLMVFLIKDSSCPPGRFNGWCDFFNTAIFFTVLSFVTYAVSFIWDIVGGVKG